jgi:hypothetical protein
VTIRKSVRPPIDMRYQKFMIGRGKFFDDFAKVEAIQKTRNAI